MVPCRLVVLLCERGEGSYRLQRYHYCYYYCWVSEGREGGSASERARSELHVVVVAVLLVES